MSTEHTQFVFFEIYNVMLSEICKDFKVKLDSRMCTDIASKNIVGNNLSWSSMIWNHKQEHKNPGNINLLKLKMYNQEKKKREREMLYLVGIL